MRIAIVYFLWCNNNKIKFRKLFCSHANITVSFGAIGKVWVVTSFVLGQECKLLFVHAKLFLSSMIRFFVGYGLELSRIIPLIIFHVKRKYLCKTEAELKEAWAPGDLGFATRIPNDMLIATIVLCYSVIAPIILPFGVLYFGLGWLVLRNQASFHKIIYILLFCFCFSRSKGFDRWWVWYHLFLS